MHTPRAFLVPILVVLGLIATPAMAHACIWDMKDSYSPFPPCKVEDMPAHDRLTQLNGRLSGKVGILAIKITTVKREIGAWQASYGAAKDYGEKMRRLYGESTANPIPSFVAEYNSRVPFARFMQLSPDGQPEFVDLRALGDSIVDSWSRDLEYLYNSTTYHAANSVEAMKWDVRHLEHQLNKEIRNAADFRRMTKAARDSIVESGLRHAIRYDGVTTDDGLSEARISTLTSLLTALRGTAVSAEAQALQSRLRVYEGSLERRRQIAEYETHQRTIRGGW
jgi:hypothetical protein